MSSVQVLSDYAADHGITGDSYSLALWTFSKDGISSEIGSLALNETGFPTTIPVYLAEDRSKSRSKNGSSSLARSKSGSRSRSLSDSRSWSGSRTGSRFRSGSWSRSWSRFRSRSLSWSRSRSNL